MEQHQRRNQREEEPRGWDPRDEPNQGRHEDEAYGKRGEREHWSGPPPLADAAGGSSSTNWDRAAGIPPTIPPTSDSAGRSEGGRESEEHGPNPHPTNKTTEKREFRKEKISSDNLKQMGTGAKKMANLLGCSVCGLKNHNIEECRRKLFW